MTQGRPKPFAVWVRCGYGRGRGSAWLFDTHATLDAAMRTARTLCGPTALKNEQVWIAARQAPAHRTEPR